MSEYNELTDSCQFMTVGDIKDKLKSYKENIEYMEKVVELLEKMLKVINGERIV